MDLSQNKKFPARTYFNITHEARPKPFLSMQTIQDSSKKIHKLSSIFHYNSKFFHQLLTKKVESLSPVAVKREDINEIARKLTKIFEKIGDSRIYFPDYMMSYIYTIFKNPNIFCCDFIEDLPLNQKHVPLPITFANNEGSKDFENQWLDIKINKNLETNEREVVMTSQKSFTNLSRIMKIEPKKLEGLFFQCNANMVAFNEYLRTRDKKFLWCEIEDKVIKEGKEKNPLAYELLTFYKSNEKKLVERENFLKKIKKF